ncbi:MAG: hypothetical protein IPI67_08125 [Myxococcales bacterium]|nr:hypothetical protein [Myxococcales bacterium]MCC6898459.1 hypothetical protein [Polyangiaceae bacterium]
MKAHLLPIACLLLPLACSSEDDAAAAKATALEAPQLTQVVPMTGALHLTWTNHQHDCDSTDAERKTDTEAYAAVFSAPGSVDNKMDGTATDTTKTYTYRLRCKRAADYSPYSNEMSGKP